jgi:phage terminase large subunit
MVERWKAKPVEFVRECFGAEPDPWQRQVLEAFPNNQRISMQACRGPGKTCVLAWLIWNFMLNENCNIAAVSLSGANLRSNLWKELSVWYSRSEFLKASYEMNSKRIHAIDHMNTWYCDSRTWTREANDEMAGETLQGLHAPFCMVILDESGGMPESLMMAARGILANAEPGGKKRIVQAGNPTRLAGPLYNASTVERPDWFVVEITGDPDSPLRSPRVDIEEARKAIAQYGRNHPFVMVTILGQFPPSSFNSLIGPNDMKAAIGRHIPLSSFDRAAKTIGIDVARYGDDETVVWPRQGLAAFEPTHFKNAHPDDIAGFVAGLFMEWNADAVEVDATGGFGDGVVDSLGRIGITALRVQFAGKPIDDRKFFNKRSEIIWLLCDWIKNGGAIAPGPWADKLTQELTKMEYTFKGDKIIIEEKEMIKAKIGRSPDYSDALACSFAFPVAPKEVDILAGIDKRGDFYHAKTEYNPLDRP